MRLDKYICKSTDLNRGQASEALQSNQVKVDGRTFTNGAVQVHESNKVTLGDQNLKLRPFRYLLVNKPTNVLCSNIDEKYPSILNYVDVSNKSELHVVGRLDADTTGLVLLTDDGSWTFNIIKPEANCEKVYRVSLRDDITDTAIHGLESGLVLQGLNKPTLPANIEVIGPREVLLTITEGKFHQVKRMFRAVGNRVRALHREKIGRIVLDVECGQWRYLTESEVNLFHSNASTGLNKEC